MGEIWHVFLPIGFYCWLLSNKSIFLIIQVAVAPENINYIAMSLMFDELILHAGREAIFILRDGMILSCNPFAEKLFNCSIDKLSDKPVKDLFVSDDHEKTDRFFKQDTPQQTEMMAIKSGGETFYAEAILNQAEYEGKTYHTLSVRDITNFKKSQQELLARDALLESINFMAAQFLASKNWRNEIRDVLGMLGKSARVSRVYIFQNFKDDDGRVYMKQTHEWTADRITPEIQNPVLRKLYYQDSGLESLYDTLSSGNVFQGLIKDFSRREREVLEAQNILSIFITPISQNGRFWGFIGFDECNYERRWLPSESKLLNTAAEIFTSVLDRESMEAEITRINKNFKTLFDQSPDAIFVYDLEGNILDVNTAACTLNGIPHADFIGKHVSDLVPEDIRSSVSREFEGWVTGKYTMVESASLNSRGEMIHVEIRGALIKYFGKSAVLLLVRDISERKKSEALLKKRIEFIRFISLISSEFIKIDLSGIEAAINKALQFVCRFTSTQRGYVFLADESETLLSLAHEFCGPGLKSHKENFESIAVTDYKKFVSALKNGEYLILHTDELGDDDEDMMLVQFFQILQIKSVIAIPLNVGDHFIGFIGFDATLQKTSWDKEIINAFSLTGQILANTLIRKKNEDDLIEAKNKAEQSDRLKTAFLGQMSHEMRTPLNSIIGFADMLERDILQQDLKEMAGFILQGGTRLLKTFNLVIDISEIEANVMQAKMQEIELNGFIREISPTLANNANEKDLSYNFQPKDPTINIVADEGMFEKVIHYLVDNAIKYTHKGSVKIVTAIEDVDDKTWASIKIIDTGIGIPKDKHHDIFNRFRQASEGYNREFEGVGLGLSVTRGMVELMDGRINVKSTPGIGSEFRVLMPLSKWPKKAGKKDRDAHVPPSGSKKKILVVEDEVVHQRYIDYILKGRYLLSYVHSAEAALESVGKGMFDLLILDINLGREMNGMELINEIRQIEGYAKVPAIAATANVMKGHRELFLSKGFTYYLAKPYKSEELLYLVERIFSGKKVKS